MRLQLERIDASGLCIELPGAGPAQQVSVRRAEALRGCIEQGKGALRLRDVGADKVVLEVLRLVFGSVIVTQSGQGILDGLRVEFESKGDHTVLDMLSQVRAEQLAIDTGSIHLQGVARIDGMRVRVDGNHGRIEAEYVSLSGFEADVGAARIRADSLVADGLVIAWGDAFTLEARSVRAPALEVEAGGTHLQASELAVEALAQCGSQVTLGGASVAKVAIGYAAVTETAPETGAPPEPEPEPVQPKRDAGDGSFDWRLLDGLRGELGIDLSLDLTVPVIGRRRATHRFRIPIDDGTIDYIELENDLSTLENTLLDFAVRDGALVLERGIPLLPTRGRGKPIVVWKLDEADLRLAQRRRVRLAVLPKAQLAGEPASEPKPERASPPSVALRRLGLQNIRARLGLTAIEGPVAGIIRALSFESLALQGEVHHVPGGEPRPGRIKGELTALRTTISGLPLGRSRLHVEQASLVQVSELDVRFAGLRPTEIRLELVDLALGRTELC